jgi:hypothetical protein
MKLLAHISIRSAVLDSLRRVPKHPWAVDFPEGTIRDLKDAKDVVGPKQRWEWKRTSCQGLIGPVPAAGANAFYRVPNIKTASANGNRSNFSRFAFPAMEGCRVDGKLGGID